ncbi:MAG: RluA family pseudouridine synthase [Puniceicoccales bacterium]|jgi:23S rRNA pseudouridine1911/1915/1917 synthase|nr:RluA family pseudouridine synthase [Puniceicoccales bacterium]
MPTLTLPPDTQPGRADKILATHLPSHSRTQIQHLIDNGHIHHPGPPPRPLTRKETLTPGQTLHITLPPPPPTQLTPAPIPLHILYEDPHLIAINKPPHLVTHPGAGTPPATLVHAVLHHTHGQLAPAGGTQRPGIVHRLDKDTTGIILLAKTDTAYHTLVHHFAHHTPDKQYLALVAPAPTLLSGTLRHPIARHPTHRTRMAVHENGKPARTDWAVEERHGKTAALLRCWLHTGRTHQIRVHLSHTGTPLLGDPTYTHPHAQNKTPFKDAPIPRIMLHAERITLPHPITGNPLTLTAPLPDDFIQAQQWLRAHHGSQTTTSPGQ